MDIEFVNLSYSRPKGFFQKEPPKTLLKSINGRFRPGTLTAIMGPSGAGKSTLLNAISGFKKKGVQGEFKVNGRRRNEEDFHKKCCYIKQDDSLPSGITVNEMMELVATLKLPIHTTPNQRLIVVDQVLEQFELVKHRDTRIQRLSGGQRKRLSIALEVITNPPVFFLDEPTSGLDNVSSTKCVELLKRLSSDNRTIVCTIHQPSPYLLGLFDHVYILSRGLCVYQGHPKGIVPFFKLIDTICPTHYTPVEYLIELADSDNIETTKLISDGIQNGKLCISAEGETKNACTDLSKPSAYEEPGQNCYTTNLSIPIKLEKELEMGNSYKESCKMFIQFRCLVYRMLIQMVRSKSGMITFFLHHIFSGLLVGLMLYGLAAEAEFFFVVMKLPSTLITIMSYTHMIGPVMNYPAELESVKIEHFNKWYNLGPYFAAVSVYKLPLQIVLSLIFYGIAYYMADLPLETFRFSLFLTIGILVAVVSDAFGILVGIIFRTETGSMLGPVILTSFVGAAIYRIETGHDLTWIHQLFLHCSYLRSTLMSLFLTMYGFDRAPLNCEEPFCLFQQPYMSLKLLNLHHGSLVVEMGAVIVMLVLFKLFSYVLLVKRYSK